MTKRVYVTPIAGKIIPMPDGNGDLPPGGTEVTLSSFWYRREKDRDVTIGAVTEPAAIQSRIQAQIHADEDAGVDTSTNIE